ncbi:MAG: LysE family transporter [Flammeovirgaceae bacterium]|nr:LysE family transporter [Flammeovirgaceae bacterium]
MILLNGIKFGFILSLLIGPVFFALLQTSIEKGFWSGVWMAIGVSISDVIYVSILYFGLSQLVGDPKFRAMLAYGGGIVLVLFGAYYIFFKNRRNTVLNGQVVAESKFYKHLLKGLVLNGLSPMVPIFWIGAISIATIDYGYQRGMDFVYFLVVY